MTNQETSFAPGRHPAESYEDILDSDAVGSPDFYREGVNPSEVLESYDTSRYYDPEFFQKEVDLKKLKRRQIIFSNGRQHQYFSNGRQPHYYLSL